MFSKADLEYLKQKPYKILLVNYHDAQIHSDRTGHDWAIVSNYENESCFIQHRHSRRDPYHLQKEHFKNLGEAVEYIDHHEEWFIANKMK